jgi:D-alanyl-lipoteichoic acid acyltransferase DltB (MBOAT superfamily)
MLFNTATYLIFLPIVFALYWTMRSCRTQNLVLLLASMVFYGWWSVPCLGLMVATCLLNYLFILLMQRRHHRKPWLILSLLLNFGVLGIFKYFNFFAENLAVLLNTVGIRADMPTLNIILPVGISFYTFQLSGYVIDVYKKQSPSPTLPLLHFLTFITFFPQLVAGPIERGSRLLPQIQNKRTFSEAEATEGMRLILWGLVKKMLIADNCAPQVDYVFSHYDTVSLPTLWLGALYFTFQIYGDFSGYSDMAVGSARLFGIHITRNFNRPYFATSMQDFWRRWHITLMSWFKDYVYIPLGGNRKGTVRKRLNTLAVFLLSGLWHGSNWTFVSWGLYHAAIYYLPIRRLAFIFVVIGWVIFRAPDIDVATGYIAGMFNPALLALPSCSKKPLALIALLMLTEWRMQEAPHPFQWKSTGCWSSQTLRFALYIIIFIVTVVYGGEKTQFIYFQF